ncbi:MAG: type VI secretion system tip protein VgrG [Holosporales bacterium]|jgi:type VI secretion system secreted protein VgrG|nr:type VI secretion system tip protein VgrG [Holosporales bacterium]
MSFSSRFFPKTQEELPITVELLGRNDLIVSRLHLREEVSNPWEGTVVLYTDSDIDTMNLPGEDVVLSFAYGADKTRYFCGVVLDASLANMHYPEKETGGLALHLSIGSSLWRLDLGRKRRIFQDITPLEIIRQTLKDNGVPNVNINVQNAGQTAEEMIVQYDETDLHFIQRLMERYGIYFYNAYDDGEDALFLADQSMSSTEMQIPLVYREKWAEGVFYPDAVYGASSRVCIGTRQFDCYAYDDAKAEVIHGASSATVDRFNMRIHEHHSLAFREKTAGDALSKIELTRANSRSIQLEGEGYCPELNPGYVCELTGSRSDTLNGKFFITSVDHVVNQFSWGDNREPIYGNKFRAIPVSVPYTPFIVHFQPRVSGCQTATVTGPSGEEVFCDSQGRIKVKFHWDTISQSDETSSCWIRVGYAWAGHKYGSVVTPRIGQEVIVEFLDGIPDYPLVTGCVYNGKNLPPENYTADRKTVSVFRTQSSKGDGYNEVRIDDLAGEEEIFVHAQKDVDIEIVNSMTETLNEGSKTVTLKSEKDPVECSLIIKKGDNKITIAEGNFVVVLDKGNHSIILKDGNQEFTLSNGDLNIDVTGSINIKATKDIKFSCDGKFMVKSTQDCQIETMASLTFSAKQNYQIECMAFKITAQTTLEMTALSGKVSATTSFEISALTFKVSATASLMITSQAAASITAMAMLSLSGSAGLSLSGAMIKLG